MNLNVTARGAVLPKAPKVKLPEAHVVFLRIEEVHPENGYDENGPVPGRLMAKVIYPEGSKNHQVSTMEDLLVQVSVHLQNRFNIASFEFDTYPKTLEVGEITLKEVRYDA